MSDTPGSNSEESDETTIIMKSIHDAARRGELEELIEYYEENSPNVAIPLEKALRLACENGHTNVARYILRQGSTNIDTQDNNGQTLLHLTCQRGQNGTVQYLVFEEGADIAMQDHNGQTPLELAIEAKQTELVDNLLQKAAERGNVDVVRRICQLASTGVDCQDENGNAPLHLACQNNCLAVVQFLVEEGGANLETQNNLEETPLQTAQRAKSTQVADYLKSILKPKTEFLPETKLTELSSPHQSGVEKKDWYTCALSQDGEDIDVGELTWSAVKDPAKVWPMHFSSKPYVFVCHRGPDTKESIARPTYWFLTKILRCKAFLDIRSFEPGSSLMESLGAAAYRCTHALVLLSPDFRRGKWCVKELNTFMSRRETQGSFKVIPALFGIKNLDGYGRSIKNINWLKNKWETDDADEYLIETLWPYLAEKFGGGIVGFRKEDLAGYLSEYKASKISVEQTEASVASSNDAATSSEPKDAIRKWLLKVLPKISEADLSQYSEKLLEIGCDSLELLNTELEPDDLGFMKKFHYKAVCQFHFKTPKNDQVGNVDGKCRMSEK